MTTCRPLPSERLNRDPQRSEFARVTPRSLATGVGDVRHVMNARPNETSPGRARSARARETRAVTSGLEDATRRG
jgi:hypothetical protein